MISYRAWAGSRNARAEQSNIGIAYSDDGITWKAHPTPWIEWETDEEYELEGFRGSALSPGGLILEDNGEAKIYYGAADTVECLATAHVDDLLRLCLPSE